MTQELQLTGGSAKQMTVSSLCTKRLWAVARRNSDGDPTVSKAIIDEIVRDPELHVEAKRIADQVSLVVRRDTAMGASPESPDYMAWYSTIQPLLLYAPPKDLPSNPKLQTAWFSIGYKATALIPIAVLKKAVDHYIETAERAFFPAWGKLNTLANGLGADELSAAYRIRAAARQEPKVEVVKTPEDRDAVRRMAEEFRLRTMPPDSLRGRESRGDLAARLRATADSLAAR